jgi:phenylalanyl-tRNA synthetase beta chain
MTDPFVEQREKATDILVSLGYDEVYTYSFISETDLTKWEIDKKIAVEVENPLTEEQRYLRPNLALNVLKIAEQNAKDNENIVASGKYFEIGNIYWKEKGEITEKTYLFMLNFPRTKKTVEELVIDFHELARRFNVEFQVRQSKEQLAEIIVAGKTVGHIGTVAGSSSLEWVGVSLDFEEFVKHIKNFQFKLINRFPSVELDSSILIREDIPWTEIKKVILEMDQRLISEIKLIEGSYQGREIVPGKKSVTFRLVYQAPSRTLTREEVHKIHNQILEELKSKFHAQIRE